MKKQAYSLKILFILVYFLQVSISFSQSIKNEEHIKDVIEAYRRKIIKNWSKNPDTSIFYVDKGYQFCDTIPIKRGRILCRSRFLKLKGISYLYKGAFKTADSVLLQALSLQKQLKPNKNLSDLYNLLSIIKRKTDVLDSSIIYANKSLVLKKKLKLWKDVPDIYDNLGNTYQDLGDYKTSISMRFKALEYYKKNNDSINIARVYANISNLYDLLEDYKSSLTYLQKGISLFKHLNAKYELADAYYNLATYYMHKNKSKKEFNHKDYELAINYLNQSYVYFKKLNVIDALGDIADLKGDIYGKLNKKEEALRHYDMAEEFYKKVNLSPRIAKMELKKVKLLLQLKKYDLAKNNLIKAKEILKNTKNIKRLIQLNESEAIYYKSVNQLDKAYNSLAKLGKLKDSIHKINLQDAIHKKLLQFKLQKIKSDNIRLQQKEKIIELRNRNLYISLSAVGLLSIFSLILLYLIIKKRKKEKIINELLLQREEQKKNELMQEVKYNMRQLTGLTLQIMQKNQMIKDLLKTTKEIERERNSCPNKIKEFKIKLLNSLSSEEDWKKFKAYFEKINPEFTKRLKEQFPLLTEKDLKLASLIKLNMNIKQTASTLNIDPNTVRMGRYRLRKKLNLQKEDSLYDFIQSI